MNHPQPKMAAHGIALHLYACLLSVPISCCLTGVNDDIPDDTVYTDSHKTVRTGDSVVLKCRFRGIPLAVYWKKGDDPANAPNVVSWIPTDDVTGFCEGERPCQIMEMNENFSLIIEEVSIAEEGRYICRVSSYRGILIHNFTDVKIFSPPKEPYQVIEQCIGTGLSAFETSDSCSISTNMFINITCLASGFYPDLDLFFIHGYEKILDKATSEMINHDGTKNKSLSIKGSPSNQPYICVASDIPGSDDQKTAAIFVSLHAAPTNASPKTAAPTTAVPTTVVSTIALLTNVVHTTAKTTEITSVAADIADNNRVVKVAIPVIAGVAGVAVVAGAVAFILRIWRKRPGFDLTDVRPNSNRINEYGLSPAEMKEQEEKHQKSKIRRKNKRTRRRPGNLMPSPEWIEMRSVESNNSNCQVPVVREEERGPRKSTQTRGYEKINPEEPHPRERQAPQDDP